MVTTNRRFTVCAPYKILFTRSKEASSKYGVEEKLIQDFGGKTYRHEITLKTYVKTGGH
jgi:hypothetical protein